MEPEELKRLVKELAAEHGDSQELVNRLEGLADADADHGFLLQSAAKELYRAGRFKSALAIAQRALTFQRQAGDETAAAESLNLLASAQHQLGDLRTALGNIKESLAHAVRTGSRQKVAQRLQNLGLIYHRLGRPDHALICLSRTLAMSTQDGDVRRQTLCRENTGATLVATGRMKEGIEHLELGLAQAREAGLLQYEASILLNLGRAYGNCGDFDHAINLTQTALAIWQTTGNLPKVAIGTNWLAVWSEARGDHDAARRCAESSLELMRSTGKRTGEGYTLQFLSRLHLDTNEIVNAEACARGALALGLSTGDVHLTGAATWQLGLTLARAGRLEEAKKYLCRGMAEIRRLGNPYKLMDCARDLGQLHSALGDAESAQAGYAEAVSALERLRANDVPPEKRRSFLRDNVSLFDGLAAACQGLGDQAGALAASERGKGRTIHDLMTSRGIESDRFSPAPMSFEQIRELAGRVNRHLVLLRVTADGTFAFTVTPDGDLNTVEAPDFTAKRLEELAMGPAGSKEVGGWFGAYARSIEAKAEARKLLDAGEFRSASDLLRRSQQDWLSTMESTLTALSDELMAPVFEKVAGLGTRSESQDDSVMSRGSGRVVLVPNRALNVLPLHACSRVVDGRRRYLLEDYEIAYAPNCNNLDLCEKRDAARAGHDPNVRRLGSCPKSTSLFAVANPAPPYDLVFSEWEVDEIAKHFEQKEVLVKTDSKQALLERAGDADVLHIATHGIHDLGSSFNSRLRLGADSEVTLDEVFEHLRLKKNWLVCLSACESGLLDYRDIADEFIGLQAGFLYAGAPTVIASLWSIADYSSAMLMMKTYEGIFRDRLSKPAALRRAQLWLRDLTAAEVSSLLKLKEDVLEYAERMAREDISSVRRTVSLEDPQSRPFSHPHFWAGFQLFGV